MKVPMGHKKTKVEKKRKDPWMDRKDLSRGSRYPWLERAASAGEDDWNDWFHVENKWRDKIPPVNNG
jgi:hypothetical protein